jgi:hypothetical protein
MVVGHHLTKRLRYATISLVSNPTPISQDAASPAADEAPDPAVLRAERRLRLLEELAEIGMELARALRPCAPADRACDDAASGDSATDKGPDKGRDPADAFARLSRAIRLTLALEARTDEALRDLKSGIVRMRAAELARAAAAQGRQIREARICGLVMEVAAAEIADGDGFEGFCYDLKERLADDEAFWNDSDRPVRDIVEHLCKCFGLAPDWSRWDGEGWIDEERPPWPWAPRSQASGAGPDDPRPPGPPAPALQPARDLE